MKGKVITWDDVPRERLTPLLERQFISGEKLTVTHLYLSKGCIVAEHSHENEQMAYLLKGRLRFWTGSGDEEVLRQGQVMHLAPNVPHSVEALEDSLALDIFSPPRQDWLDGTDDYLREK